MIPALFSLYVSILIPSANTTAASPLPLIGGASTASSGNLLHAL